MLLVLGLAAGALVAVRAALQHRQAQALRITTADGISEAGYVDIGGTPQWVQIRGAHRTNPVVLVVHGGPGFAMSPLSSVFQPWERDVTVVQWDQRDAGKTFSRNGPQPLSLDQAARDGIAVAEHLRARLPGAPIIVLGHSWGSAVGLTMIQRRPDLFTAYVGAGQMSDKPAQEAISYATVAARLQARGDTRALAELRRAGPPPYRSLADLLVERTWLAKVDTPAERALFSRMTPLVFTAPGMSLRDLRLYLAAPKAAQGQTFTENVSFDARRLGAVYRTPLVIVEGDQDLYTPPGPTARWLAGVTAPAKRMVILPGAGHDALLTEPQAFLAVLKKLSSPDGAGQAAERPG